MKRGDQVRITADALGVLDPKGFGFTFSADVILNRGDVATYDGPMMDADWYRLTVERDGVTYECPAHDSQFDPID